MKSWNLLTMLVRGQHHFHKLAKRKRHAHHNHDVHNLARDIESWLPVAMDTLITGHYDPLPVKRLYFPDAVVDQLAIEDRVMQNVLLQQLKPTFGHIVNRTCYHMAGPSGVKAATTVVRKALDSPCYSHFIRLDIKSFYASISRYKLVADIKQYFDDERVRNMLARIINNPLEHPGGIRNPDLGIALRGPLSQLFSALYLKPLDDAFSAMDLFYARYNDDVLILCRSRRQQLRAKRKISQVLQERRLTLSRKKSCMGSLEQSFHFLGIHYLGTQPQDNTTPMPLDKLQQHQTSPGLKLTLGVASGISGTPSSSAACADCKAGSGAG